MLIQFAIILMMPLLLCIAFCWWLCESFGVGLWIYLPGVILGIGAGAVSAYRFCRGALKLQEKKRKRGQPAPPSESEEEKRPVAFNEHI